MEETIYAAATICEDDTASDEDRQAAFEIIEEEILSVIWEMNDA